MAGEIAIRAQGLSKQYRIGERARYKTLRDRLSEALRVPVGKFTSFFQRSSLSREDRKAANDKYIWALKDVSFEVKAGEAVGIIGCNGAGKTTLLKILSRITEPTEGCVEAHGRVVSLLEVGTGFHPELTGRENIYLNGAILGMKRKEIEREFDEIVAFSGIDKFIDTPVKYYSSGMYVRLAFAVAAHLEPDILLVDEVLAVGDAAFQKKCLAKAGDVAKQGRTVLFVSHNMAAITTLTRRCILLSEGKVGLDGDTPTVTDSYLADSASRDQGGIVNLRERIQRTGSPDVVELIELVMSDKRGANTAQFYENDPIDMRITFQVKQPIQVLEIGLTVSSRGVRLFTVDSGERPWMGSPGSYTITTSLDPNPLCTGIYHLTPGIRSSAWQDGDYDVAAFQIVPNPTGQRNYPIDGDNGILYLPYRWSDPVPSLI